MDDDSVAEIADPLVLRARARIGQVLRAKWRLDVLLGVGGMAAVYAATHETTASRAAIKILHAELSLHAEVRTRFAREARLANTVGHPGAVRVIDEDRSEDGAAYLVMELLDGESLEDRAKRHGGKLNVDEVLSAVHQLLDVLGAAHEKGVVHRDLKPDNVFLTRDGSIRVLDFGIARLRELSRGTKATAPGSTLGTPSFMAPEQARGRHDEVDGRSDLWAVGASMFALLAGRCVHEERTVNETLLAAMTKPAPPLRSIALEVPQAVAEVVDRALAFDREARWPDARAMQEAVMLAYERVHSAPISTGPKLLVPEIVPNRTLPSSEFAPAGAGSAGTVGPVTNGIHGASILRTISRHPGLALGAAGAGLLVLAAVAVTILLKIGASGATPAASASIAAPAPASAIDAPAAASAAAGGASPPSATTPARMPEPSVVVAPAEENPPVSPDDLKKEGELARPKPPAAGRPPPPLPLPLPAPAPKTTAPKAAPLPVPPKTTDPKARRR